MLTYLFSYLHISKQFITNIWNSYQFMSLCSMKYHSEMLQNMPNFMYVCIRKPEVAFTIFLCYFILKQMLWSISTSFVVCHQKILNTYRHRPGASAFIRKMGFYIQKVLQILKHLVKHKSHISNVYRRAEVKNIWGKIQFIYLNPTLSAIYFQIPEELL